MRIAPVAVAKARLMESSLKFGLTGRGSMSLISLSKQGLQNSRDNIKRRNAKNSKNARNRRDVSSSKDVSSSRDDSRGCKIQEWQK
jgi:hypothetical protein